MNCASGMRANDSLAGQLARVCPVQLHALITSSSTMQCTLSPQPLTAACRRWAAAMARRPSQPPLPRPCAPHSRGSPRLQDQQGAGDAGWAHKNVEAAPTRGSDWHPPGMPTGAPREWVSAAHGHMHAPGSQLSRGPLHPAPLAVTTTSSSMRTPPKPCNARARWRSAAQVGAA